MAASANVSKTEIIKQLPLEHLELIRSAEKHLCPVIMVRINGYEWKRGKK